MKHKTKLLMMIVSGFLFTACQHTDSQQKSANNPQANEPIISTTTSTSAPHAPNNQNPNWQTYLVGSQLTYPPFHYQDEKGEPMGFEMELLKAVAQAGEFNISVHHAPRTSLEQTLADGSIQIWSSTVSINPERLEKMDFSQPFMHIDRNVLILQDKPENQSIKKPEDLKNKKIAVNTMSKKNQELAAKLTGDPSRVVITPSYALSMKELLTGNVDAVMDNGLVLDNFLKNNSSNIAKTRSILISEEKKDFAFAVKKGNQDLINQLNKGLEKIKSDGTYQKLVEKWFGNQNI